MNTHDSTHLAAVITPQQVYYGSGHVINASGLTGDLATVLRGTAGRFDDHCTIVIDAPHPADYTAQLDRVRAAGWAVADPGDDGPGAWSLFYRDGRTVAVGWLPVMRPARHFGVLFNRDTDPGVMAMLIDRFHRLTGMSWRGTPATTAHAGIRAAWPARHQQPLWSDAKKGPGYVTSALDWSRKLHPHEREWGFLHTYDANAAYLGAMITAELAWSGLENVGVQPFSKHKPGYWLLLVSGMVRDWPDDGRPPLVEARRIISTPAGPAFWTTTPFAELLAHLGDPLAVVDSWTAATHGRSGARSGIRLLRGWAERVRDARNALRPGNDPLATAVKRLYKDAIGGMQRPTMRVARPDWAYTVIDLWRANLWRRMLKVHAEQGVWPVAVATDSLTYADSVPAVIPRRTPTTHPTMAASLNLTSCNAGCGCAPSDAGRLGEWKHERVWTVDEWDQAHAPKLERQPRVPRQRRERVTTR